MTASISNHGFKRLCVAVVLFLFGMLAVHGVFVWQVKDLLRQGYQDFTMLYCGGRMVNLGLAGQLYDDQLQYKIQQSIAPNVAIRKGPLPYNHPPFEALLFAPLARLPYFIAFLCWSCVNLVLLSTLGTILRPHVLLVQRISGGWLFLASLAFFPLLISLVQGQDTVLLLLLFAMAYAALKRRADFSAGCWLGLGVFRFHLVVPVILILGLCRRLKTVLGFILISCTLGVISVALVGWREALAYPRYLLQTENALGRRAIVPYQMPDLRGFLVTTLSGYLPPVLTKVLIVLLSFTLLYFVSLAVKASRDGTIFDLGYSLGLIAAILTGYHSYIYDLSIGFLAVLLVLNYSFVNGTTLGWNGAKLYLPICLLFLTPLQVILLLRYDQFHLYALVLMLWTCGIATAMAKDRKSKASIPVPVRSA